MFGSVWQCLAVFGSVWAAFGKGAALTIVVYRMVCTARKVHAADVSMVMHAMYGMYGSHISEPTPNRRSARFGVENPLQNTCF